MVEHVRNLVIAVCGNDSLHRHWISHNFDLFVVYYDNGRAYEKDGKYFVREKGTKFNIIAKLDQTILKTYDAIFIPDDDLYIDSDTITRFFSLFHQYRLAVAQPAIMGWASVPITFAQPMTIIRYTNWVEIMCPCFSKEAFQQSFPAFTENRSGWGIEHLWPSPKAIIDDTIAFHTRPCFYGDTYANNGLTFDTCCQELETLLVKYNLRRDIKTLETIKKDEKLFIDLPSEQKCFPDTTMVKKVLQSRLT